MQQFPSCRKARRIASPCNIQNRASEISQPPAPDRSHSYRERFSPSAKTGNSPSQTAFCFGVIRNASYRPLFSADLALAIFD
jgi:hypothetical protein